jgi:hypothetical protein
MGFHLATGAPIPDEPAPDPQPTFHPVLGFTHPEEN